MDHASSVHHAVTSSKIHAFEPSTFPLLATEASNFLERLRQKDSGSELESQRLVYGCSGGSREVSHWLQILDPDLQYGEIHDIAPFLEA